jgi:hypothetical protein
VWNGCCACGAVGALRLERCGERQSRARSGAKQRNILCIENIEDNHSNVIASLLLGWATVNAWSVEQIILAPEKPSQHHHKL